MDNDFKRNIIENGLYSRDENLRIYNKFFSNSPRYIFKAVDKKFGITNKKICDVGCHYGFNLIHASKDSYGIEIDPYYADFAKSLGLKIYRKDIYDDISGLPKVDVVWCSAVLEHVESPHSFLRRLNFLLKPNGIIVIFVPTIPLIPSFRKIKPLERYLTGYLHGDHINAFVPSTLKFTAERAGFKTIALNPFTPRPLAFLIDNPLLNRLIDGCIYIGEKIENWEYPDNASRRTSIDSIDFKYISD